MKSSGNGIVVVLGVFLALSSAVAPLQAVDRETWSGNSGPTRKLIRGSTNALFGWTEIVSSYLTEEEVDDAFVRSLTMPIKRTGAGFVETGTFAIPPYDEPMVEPTSPFAYEDVERREAGFPNGPKP